MPEEHVPPIFCPECLSYFPPDLCSCSFCGRARSVTDNSTPALMPGWQLPLGGKPAGSVLFNENKLVTAWSGPGDHPKTGGMSCFDLEERQILWSVPLEMPPLGRPVISGGTICQLSGHRAAPSRIEFLSSDGETAGCCNLEGTAAPRLLAFEGGAVCCALSSGTLMAVDPHTRTCRKITRFEEPRLNPPQSISLMDKRIFLIANGARPGQVIAVQGKAAAALFTLPDPCYFTNLFLGGKREFYVSDEMGRLFALDDSGRKRWCFQAGNGKSPSPRLGRAAAGNDSIFLGGTDHRVRSLERGSGKLRWEREVDGSVMGRPLLWDNDLLICSDSHGFMYGLDASDGHSIWQYQCRPAGQTSVRGNLTRWKDYLVYSAGGSSGDTAGILGAIPFHAGRHDWAAARAESGGGHREAAIHYALMAGACSDEEQEGFLEKSARAFTKARQAEWGARLWFGVGSRKKAMEANDRAAQTWRVNDPVRAAHYYLTNAGILENEGFILEAAEYQKKAESLAPLPYLSLSLMTDPRLDQYQPGQITLRIKNTGRSDAKCVKVHVGGNLLQPVRFFADRREYVPPNRWWDLELSITPSRAENRLEVCVECQEREESPEPLRFYFHGTISAAPGPITIKTGDMVKGKIRVSAEGDRPVRLEIGDSVFSEIEVET